MNQGEGHFASRGRACAPVLVICAAIVAAVMTGMSTPPAQALPSFARQTGQPCGTCHTDFPGSDTVWPPLQAARLHDGRRPLQDDAVSDNPGPKEAYTELRDYADRIDGKAPPARPRSREDLGAAGLDDGDCRLHPHASRRVAPPTDPYKPNDNIVLSPFSGFWGGAITATRRLRPGHL